MRDRTSVAQQSELFSDPSVQSSFGQQIRPGPICKPLPDDGVTNTGTADHQRTQHHRPDILGAQVLLPPRDRVLTKALHGERIGGIR